MASSAHLAIALGLQSIVFVARCALAADPTAAEKETARTMMDHGHASRLAGDHRAALEQFKGADAIMHVPTTAFELAREQVALGLLVEGRDTLVRVLRSQPSAGEPEPFRAARKAAAALDDEIERRIPALRITLQGSSYGDDLRVTVDGTPLPADALVAPFKVNPGHHVVKATMSTSTASQEVDVAEAQTASVELTFTPAPSAPSPQEAADAPPASTSANVPDQTPSGSPGLGPWLRWGGFGLAIAGTAVGSVSGMMSISKTSSVSKGCVNNQCSPSAQGDIDSARTMATVADVSFVAAGVGLVLGVTSFFVAGSQDSAASRSHAGLYVAPGVGMTSAGFAGTF